MGKFILSTGGLKLRRSLYRIYWKMERLIAPELRSSQYLYEDLLRSYLTPPIKWLDLACGHQILPSWCMQDEGLAEQCSLVVGIDPYQFSLREHRSISLRLADRASKLPLKSALFDLVTANMVVEHMSDPTVMFCEVNRVSKAGGIFLLHTPNKWGYAAILTILMPSFVRKIVNYVLHGRKEDVLFPTFFRCNTPTPIFRLARESGFQVKKLMMVVSSAECAIVPPLALLELAWIRLLMTKPFGALRTNIIAVLQKESPAVIDETGCCNEMTGQRNYQVTAGVCGERGLKKGS